MITLLYLPLDNFTVVEPLTILIMAYLSFIVAELFHWSGIIRFDRNLYTKVRSFVNLYNVMSTPSLELYHFHHSMIGCGLVQAQYAMENISRKSYITVHYFIKMLRSAC